MTPLTQEQITAYKAKMPATVEQEPMAKHTSFRVGGSARLYVVVHSSSTLLEAVEAALAAGIPFYLYGGGSNLLVSDDGFEGVIIQTAHRGIEVKDTNVSAEAGAITAMVARTSVEAGLTGFEWAIGVPGTIGGALYGNAGCYGGEMKDAVESVDAFNLETKEHVRLTNADCQFGYRNSLFKNKPYLILGCQLALKVSPDAAASKARLEEIMGKRKDSQPLGQSSAGCVFKNVEFSDPKELEILSRSVEVPEAMKASGKISAGWLIDQAGLLGKTIGEVSVSKKHGNFFVNAGQARAQDILALISLVKMKVRDDLGIELQEEVQYVGF